jgi:hypothetical protein
MILIIFLKAFAFRKYSGMMWCVDVESAGYEPAGGMKLHH